MYLSKVRYLIINESLFIIRNYTKACFVELNGQLTVQVGLRCALCIVTTHIYI